MPELSYREAVRDAMSQAMRRDDEVFVMGEDIAEMGGSMGVTQGMLEEFGPERVRNTPISEMAIVGAGIGAAIAGIAAGALAQYVVLRTIRLGYIETLATPRLIPAVDVRQLMVIAVASAVVFGAFAVASAALTVRGARGATLRESAR